MATKKKEISIRAYATLLKVDEKTVRKARDAGLLKGGYNATTGKIVPALADKAWGFTQKVVKAKPGVSRAKAIQKLEGDTRQNGKDAGVELNLPERVEEMDPEELQACLPVSSDMPLVQAMRYREIIALALDKIKLRRETGALLDKDKVNTALFKVSRAMRDRLLLIPKRISGDVFAAQNEVEVINIITGEITQFLLTLSAEFKIAKV